MANYSASVLAKGQAMVSAKYQAPEQRRKRPTLMERALQNQQISIPDANALRVSEHRPVEINYFTDVAPGNAVTKTALHTGGIGDTAKVSLTYVTHVETIGIPRKIADNNIASYQQMFNNLYEMKWKNLRQRHNDSALAYLLAHRCQLAAATMNPQIVSAGAGQWNEANFALEIAGADQKLFAQKLKSFMFARMFYGELDVFADIQTSAMFEFLMNQGQGNQTNLGFQYSGLNVAETQELLSAAYPNGAVLALPAGLFAGMHWNEPLNRRGVDGGTTDSIGNLGTIADPFGSGAVADISTYTQRSDTSADANNGSPQDILDQYELTLTIAYALPPLSVENDSVLHLVGQAA